MVEIDSTVIVAGIGLIGLAGGWLVTRVGQRAEARDRAVADSYAREHQEFLELQSIVEMHRRDRDEARTEVDRLRRVAVEAQTASDLAVERALRVQRKALADMEALRALVAGHVAREARDTAEAMREAEER